MKLKYNSWDKISIKKYYELEGLEKDSEILAVLCECSEEEIANLPYLEYQNLVGEVGWLKTFTFDTKHDLKKVKIGNRKYKVVNTVGKMTTAQYIDFQTLYAKNDLKTYYGSILATFLIPVKKKSYNQGYDVVEEARYIYENCNIQLANQVMYFFLKRCLLSTRIMLTYSVWIMERTLKRKKTPEETKKIIAERLPLVKKKLAMLGLAL